MIPRRSWLRDGSKLRFGHAFGQTQRTLKQMPNSLNRSVVDTNKWWHSNGVAMKQKNVG
jgi:hypothetical protein